MNFEEFKEKKAECNRKLKEAVVIDEMREALENFIIADKLKDLDKRKISLTYEQVPGKPPIIGVEGNGLDIAFAIGQIMDYDDSFYDVLRFVCHYRRIQELGAFKVVSGGKIYCENKEQRDLIRELWSKSPEELEKLKKRSRIIDIRGEV